MFRLILFFILSIIYLLPKNSPAQEAAGVEPPLQIGLSAELLKDVNENDARAALKVWMEALYNRVKVAVNTDIQIFHSQQEIVTALKKERINGIGLTTVEYFDVTRQVPLGRFFLDEKDGRIATEKIVLLARKGSDINGLEDLKGKRLALYDNRRMSLARTWLELELHRRGLPRLEQLTAKLHNNRDLGQVVLPLFFGKEDVALVTANGFRTMVELNPQLAKELKVVAESEPVVPSIVAFRRDNNQEELRRLFEAANNLETLPTGRQVLTLFQSQAVREGTLEEIAPTLQLIRAWHRIRPDLEGAGETKR